MRRFQASSASFIVEGVQAPPAFNALVDAPLAAVIFVMNYWQLDFQGSVLTVLAPSSIDENATGMTLRSGEIGFRDALCACIGQTLNRVVQGESDGLRLEFANGATLTILEDRLEAWELRLADGTWVVG